MSPSAELPFDERVRARGIQRVFARGQFLFHAGTPAQGLFIILEGRVRVVNERDGRRHLVHEETTGATLGEVPLLLGGGYPASAVAAARTRCLILSREALRLSLADSPDFAWQLLGRMASRVRTLVGRLGIVSTVPVRQALAALILERGTTDAASLPLAASQQELAESLGTVREVVARQLTWMRRAGALRSAGRGKVAVADRKLLRQIAGLGPV